MNTAVEYKRPSHRNRYGQYKSITQFQYNEIVGNIKIFLVWFNGLGWYYSVELQATWWLGNELQPMKNILDFSKNTSMWKLGKQLPLCAQAAEDEARNMLEKYGVAGLNFMPYDILPHGD